MIVMKKEKQSLISSRHPWIYRNALTIENGEPDNGELVPVLSEEGKVLCWGFYSAQSFITVRIISFGSEKPEDTWIEERIKRAALLRKSLLLRSNAYRLINAEGDGIPGLIVDIYNTTTVIKPLVHGIENRLDSIIDIFGSLFPENSIFLRRDEYAARREKLVLKNGYMKGNGDGKQIIEEDGITFLVDIEQGQKTGFYIDQRDNRILFSRFCKGKTVLNLFSYTGAFALHAVRGEAVRVVSVESSAYAVELSKQQVSLNPALEPERFSWVCGDAFHILDTCESYNTIIIDPPPFARRKAELEGALRGYRRLTEKALEKLTSQGVLFTFSCSSAAGKALFRDTIKDAARKSGRYLRIIHELSAPPDHPISIFHPEGEYLKGLIIYAE
jgi:23S rRNA (cytosine1962-C5)-methyltransferase